MLAETFGHGVWLGRETGHNDRFRISNRTILPFPERAISYRKVLYVNALRSFEISADGTVPAPLSRYSEVSDCTGRY
jgi:hypothetical protein